MGQFISLVMTAVLLSLSCGAAKEQGTAKAAFDAAFALCIDVGLSPDARLARLADARWTPLQNLPLAVEMKALWDALRQSNPTGRDFARILDRSRASARTFFEVHRNHLTYRVHKDFSGLLDVAAPRGTSATDKTDGGECTFLSGADLPGPLPTGHLNAAGGSTKPLIRSRPYVTNATYPFLVRDADGRTWRVVMDVTEIETTALSELVGHDFGLRNVLKIYLIPERAQ